MRNRAGGRSFDRRVTFERRVADDSFASAGAEAWEEVVTVAAQVQDALPSRGERLSDGLTMATRPSRIRIRWRADITPDMRIIYGGRTMEIVAGPAELGRRDMLEMMAADFATVAGGG